MKRVTWKYICVDSSLTEGERRVHYIKHKSDNLHHGGKKNSFMITDRPDMIFSCISRRIVILQATSFTIFQKLHVLSQNMLCFLFVFEEHEHGCIGLKCLFRIHAMIFLILNRLHNFSATDTVPDTITGTVTIELSDVDEYDSTFPTTCGYATTDAIESMNHIISNTYTKTVLKYYG